MCKKSQHRLPAEVVVKIREVINCVDGFSLADDEVTDYELIRKGDSLIIIEPKN